MTQIASKNQRKTTPVGMQSAKPTTAKYPPTHDEISQRAKQLWQAKGYPSGRDEEIWLEAEAQLRGGA